MSLANDTESVGVLEINNYLFGFRCSFDVEDGHWLSRQSTRPTGWDCTKNNMYLWHSGQITMKWPIAAVFNWFKVYSTKFHGVTSVCILEKSWSSVFLKTHSIRCNTMSSLWWRIPWFKKQRNSFLRFFSKSPVQEIIISS